MVYHTEDLNKIFESVRNRIPGFKFCLKTINKRTFSLRSNIADYGAAVAFVKEFQTETKSRFKILSHSGASSIRVCRTHWICKYRSRKKECCAAINILIKKVNKHTLNDAFLQRDPPLPAIIKINSNHYHSDFPYSAAYKFSKENNDRNSLLQAAIKIKSDYNHLLNTLPTSYKSVSKSSLARIDDGVKMCFYEYFKRGFYDDRAKSLHEYNLRKTNTSFLKVKSMNPSLKEIREIYNYWEIMNEYVRSNPDYRPSESSQMHVTEEDFYSKVAQSFSGNLELLNVYDEMVDNGNESGEVYYVPVVNIANDGTKDIYVPMEIVNEAGGTYYTPVESILYESIERNIFHTPVENNEDDTHMDDSTNKVIRAVEPVLNIKQEVIDEDENGGLPVISNYGNEISMSETNNEAVEDSCIPMEHISDNNYAFVESINNKAVEGDYIPAENVVNDVEVDDDTPMGNIVNKAAEYNMKNFFDKVFKDIQPVLNIKKEIINEDENDGLPVISNYGHAYDEAVEDDYTPMENTVDEAIDANHTLMKNVNKAVEDDYIPVEKTANDDIPMENIINKAAKDDYTLVENISDKVVKNIQPVLSIKQEIFDENENDELPVISYYGSASPVVNMINQAVENDCTPMENVDKTTEDNYISLENAIKAVEDVCIPVKNTVKKATEDDCVHVENFNKAVVDIKPVLNIKQEIDDEFENGGLYIVSNYDYMTPEVNNINEAINDDYTPEKNFDEIEDYNTPVINIIDKTIKDNYPPVVSNHDRIVIAPVWIPEVFTPESSVSTRTTKETKIAASKAKTAVTTEAKPVTTTEDDTTIAKTTSPAFPAVQNEFQPYSEIVIYDSSIKRYKVVKNLAVDSGTFPVSQYESHLSSTRTSFHNS